MLPGGQADKIGNRYEHWWTVLQLVRMISGEALSIRIEHPGIDKSEFVLITPNGTEYHQAKHSNDSGSWSMADLASAKYGVLRAIHGLLAGNNERFHFVSGSEARELKELSDRARQLESWDEFLAVGLKAQKHQGNWARLLSSWQHPTATDAYAILRRVFVHTADEEVLCDVVKSRIRALYLAEPTTVVTQLRSIALDKVGVTLEREELVSILAGEGYKLRKLSHIEMALPAIEAITVRFLEDLRSRLIGGDLIRRNAADEITTRITSGTGLVTALTGTAGGGKSACTFQLVQNLRGAGFPVLAFRLDRVPQAASAIGLGKILDLEESPVLVLAAAAQGRPYVLVLDQLDAVSSVSGRNAGFVEAVEDLIREARGMSVPIHVVVVCRKFDWDNDHRLRGLVQSDDVIVELSDFSEPEVADALSTAGFEFGSLAAHQKELLRRPQNLALFMATPGAWEKLPTFGSTKDLFDGYWREKRDAVRKRSAPELEVWGDVLDCLTDRMTYTQRLSVEIELLDSFPIAYIDQMISEGVLSKSGGQIGFGHESFFDYCYARSFVRKDQTLLDLLRSGEQHLFRRAQVRQVLAYLRDSRVDRYCKEIQNLLGSTDVRTHIKDLTLSLIASVPEVRDEEWKMLFPRMNDFVDFIAEHGEHVDRTEIHFWRNICGSDAWFRAANRKGVIAGWIGSDSRCAANLMTNYMKLHQRKNGDAVAALLEPFTDGGGEWAERLRYSMEWAEHGNSRRYFDLLLRLVDNGVLDKARHGFVQNGAFWSMFYGLTESKPEWIPELFAHWLRRRFTLVSTQCGPEGEANWSMLLGDDDSGQVALSKSAKLFPNSFVQCSLGLCLEIAEAAASRDESRPRRDAVWLNLFPGEIMSMASVCAEALRESLRVMADGNSDAIPEIVADLRRRDTYFSNLLLITIYTAAVNSDADEVVDMLFDEPWRLECGYCGSSYWFSRQLVTAVAPRCSSGRLAALEALVLHFEPDWELRSDTRRYRGGAMFDLLSAIPEPLRSAAGQARFLELQRKFQSPTVPSGNGRGGFVGSPIANEKALLMTDVQWLSAIARYESTELSPTGRDFLKGTARELAIELEQFTRCDPERFGALALQFPVGTNSTYVDRVLSGLGGSSVSLSLKLDVCRKAFSESRIDCARTIARLLGGIEEVLPDDCIGMIHWIATEHPDPAEESWRVADHRKIAHCGGDIYRCGVNSARGCAAEAVADLIAHESGYIERLMPTISILVKDPSTAVRSCTVRALLALATQDAPRAIALFGILANHDPVVLATPFGERFIHCGIRDHFSEVRPFIEILLRSGLEATAEAGARLSLLAVLYGHDARSLVVEASQGSVHQRLGVAKTAAANIGRNECREVCESLLLEFFCDSDREVRKEAAKCFKSLKELPLGDYEKLFAAYCESAAYGEDSFWVLHVLAESRHRLPGIVWRVCERFLARFGCEGADIRNVRAGHAREVATLIYRTYQQHLEDEWAPQCLNLIDAMLLDGIYDARSGLTEFER